MADGKEAPHGQEFFGLTEDGDGHEYGTPFDNFVTALCVWSRMQKTPPTVADAMLTFNCTLDVIQKAVEAHYWLLLSGDPDQPQAMTIEEDGL